MFGYIFFSGRHFPLSIAGACSTVLFVESSVRIVVEPPSTFQHKLNLLQRTNSSFKLGEHGIFEINNLIQIFLKCLRSKRTLISAAENFCRAVFGFGNINNSAAATGPALRNPEFFQVEPTMYQLSEGEMNAQ